MPPAELVRKTVANELVAANAPGHYRYRLRRTTPSGSQTKDVIETRSWRIERLFEINDKPLNPERQAAVDARLGRLIDDPGSLQALRKKQQRDEGRVRSIVNALPVAFLYEYAGSEGKNGGNRMVHLKFRANPRFDPSSRVLQVLQGMEGTMVVDSAVDRLFRVDARLVREVDFGWGVFGRLYRGGSFLLEQRDTGTGRWAITRLELHFTGKLLLFKKLKIDFVAQTSGFRQMPDDLTLHEGLQLLLAGGQMTTRPCSPATRKIPKPATFDLLTPNVGGVEQSRKCRVRKPDDLQRDRY